MRHPVYMSRLQSAFEISILTAIGIVSRRGENRLPQKRASSYGPLSKDQSVKHLANGGMLPVEESAVGMSFADDAFDDGESYTLIMAVEGGSDRIIVVTPGRTTRCPRGECR